MMYLSKGLSVPEKDGTVRVSHCGRIFALGPEMAALWESARLAPQPVPPQKARFVERLEQSGLAVTTQEEGGLALYRLLSGSIICPQAEPEGQFSEAGWRQPYLEVDPIRRPAPHSQRADPTGGAGDRSDAEFARGRGAAATDGKALLSPDDPGRRFGA